MADDFVGASASLRLFNLLPSQKQLPREDVAKKAKRCYINQLSGAFYLIWMKQHLNITQSSDVEQLNGTLSCEEPQMRAVEQPKILIPEGAIQCEITKDRIVSYIWKIRD